MFRDRLEEFLQREFDAHVNDLLASSQKPRCISFSLTMDSFADPAAISSGVLHAQIVKGMEDLRVAVFGAVDIVTARTGLRINQLSPLDRLSDDILMLILLHLDNRDTFFATKVSRRWRAVALSTPSLWATIDLSCCPVEFEERFQLFVMRSKQAPLDVKLKLESTDVDASDVEEGDYDSLYDLWTEQCELDVDWQLGHDVQKIAVAPAVLARVRTLDITSRLTSDPGNCYHGNLNQPTPKLQLAATPSLRRLRLNWAEPAVHELHLVLDPSLGTYDSVSLLALCAVDNLREVLPRFSSVVELSLWLDDSAVYHPFDIQLADICAWMPQLRKLEIVEAPENFASKPLVTKPSLHRLVLHGEFAREVLTQVAGQIDLNEIPEISLRNHTLDAFKTGFIPVAGGPADQLSLYVGHDYPKWLQPNSGCHFYAEDGCRRLRYLHSKYKKLDCEEMVSYATINTNIEALFEVLPEKMPQLVRFRIYSNNLRSHKGSKREPQPRPPRSCPALAHLELYVGYDRTSDEGEVLSGVEVVDWIACHLQDFPQPLDTLRVVGVRVDSDLAALNNLARTVSVTSTAAFE